MPLPCSDFAVALARNLDYLRREEEEEFHSNSKSGKEERDLTKKGDNPCVCIILCVHVYTQYYVGQITYDSVQVYVLDVHHVRMNV